MGSVAVVGFGNSRPLSVIEVLVDGLHVETTYFDNWKLESAVLDWYRTQDLDQIIAVPLIIKTTRPSTS